MTPLERAVLKCKIWDRPLPPDLALRHEKLLAKKAARAERRAELERGRVAKVENEQAQRAIDRERAEIDFKSEYESYSRLRTRQIAKETRLKQRLRLIKETARRMKNNQRLMDIEVTKLRKSFSSLVDAVLPMLESLGDKLAQAKVEQRD